MFYEPELDPETGKVDLKKHPLVRKHLSFKNSIEPEFVYDLGNDDDEDDVEDEEQRTYMYNIKTGSMIPSSYMLHILPEPKPQRKGAHDPE